MIYKLTALFILSLMTPRDKKELNKTILHWQMRGENKDSISNNLRWVLDEMIFWGTGHITTPVLIAIISISAILGNCFYLSSFMYLMVDQGFISNIETAKNLLPLVAFAQASTLLITAALIAEQESKILEAVVNKSLKNAPALLRIIASNQIGRSKEVKMTRHRYKLLARAKKKKLKGIR